MTLNNMEACNMVANSIHIGTRWPELRVGRSAQKIISAPAATRDWQPIHHDYEIASKSGLRGIILNAPSQAGWISKYITDWTGPHARIKRLAFKMKDSICPGDELIIKGEIIGKTDDFITAEVSLLVGDKLKTSAEVCFSLPA